MCGICGEVVLDGSPDLGLVQAMVGSLVHRGPDGAGWFRDETAALGHSRLAIIDVQDGAQPLSNEDGSWWVVFNGEIYNHVELRRELIGFGHQFRTRSDTEVIVHAWEQWGAESFQRFNGQWAIALWSPLQQTLILARDPHGVRPLYYVRDGGRLLFASEVKALFTDPRVPRAFDPGGLAQILSLWAPVAPRTAFAGVEQLPPGHWARWESGAWQSERYAGWEFPSWGEEPYQDAQANRETLREVVLQATRLRFERSDVPVGAYVSGGIDSAVLTTLLAREVGADLTTFSLRFEDAGYDEGSYQHAVVEVLGSRHHEVVARTADIEKVFPEVVWHAETPILRSAPAPMFLLSRLVADHGFKVVVTGEGADEVLGGYDLFRETLVRLFAARDPNSTVRQRAMDSLYPWLERSPAQAPAFARAFFAVGSDPDDVAVSHRPRWQTTSSVRGLLSPDLAQAVDRADIPSLDMLLPEGAKRWDPLARAQYLEAATLLPGYLLSSQGDRMLMAHSVEGRFPFLDPDVVRFAHGIPARHKVFGLDEKYLLKRAFERDIPEAVRMRPKQPYRAPDAAAFLGAPSQWLDEVTSPSALADAGVFDARFVSALLAKARRRGGRSLGNTDNMRVMAVVSTQLLHQQFIAGPVPTPAIPPFDVEIDRLTSERIVRDDR